MDVIPMFSSEDWQQAKCYAWDTQLYMVPHPLVLESQMRQPENENKIKFLLIWILYINNITILLTTMYNT